MADRPPPPPPPVSTNTNIQEGGDDIELGMTPSTDDMLEVSPANSSSLRPTDSAEAAMEAARRSIDAFSSSSSSSDDDDDSNEDGVDGVDDEEEEVEESGEDGSRSHSEGQDSDFASEFDKALHRGKGQPSKGKIREGSVAAAIAAARDALPPPPPPPASHKKGRGASTSAGVVVVPAASSTSRISQSSSNISLGSHHASQQPLAPTATATAPVEDPLASGILPDVLMTMRQKLESLQMFDSDMMKLAQGGDFAYRQPGGPSMEDAADRETRESLKRSSQQSISAAVLVSLAHKRYERRRLAAMEIEKVVRSLVQQDELERVRAILLLLSDDYVRSASEDARKGGVVALAASAIGLKKAAPLNPLAHECRDLILASVVHACQDHSQRVRYYATESLFNVVKVIPALAIQHFFILFEILRSLYADVDVDVKSGAELLDKKLKEVIVGAMNSGQFTADACVPVFARFVYMRNKATKRLTLTWLQELAEKLIGAPILEFLHLLLAGIFDMVADPTVAIRQSALAFLQSVLPKLLTVDDHVRDDAIDDIEDGGGGSKVDFDKILQSLVTTMEHPDPFVRKVAMYWMSRIVKAHIDGPTVHISEDLPKDLAEEELTMHSPPPPLSAATISVRNSLPHVLPGILLSIGDTHSATTMAVKDFFLPDTTTHALAAQTNACLQAAVRDSSGGYVQHLDSFIVALREELDSPGGVLQARNPPAILRQPYRMDVKHDGTGIESPGWFRANPETPLSEEGQEDAVSSMMLSRLCALDWVRVLYESVVPDVLKADYAREFVIPIIHQLVDNPPERIVYKSLEVLAIITVPVQSENLMKSSQVSSATGPDDEPNETPWEQSPMSDSSVDFGLGILDEPRQKLQSRDREVFAVLIQLHAYNLHLIGDVSKVIAYMCQLQPAEFVFLSFAVELERFAVRQSDEKWKPHPSSSGRASHVGTNATWVADQPLSRDLHFVSSFIQQMCHVLLNANEAKKLRDVLKDCIGHRQPDSEEDLRRARLFHILLHCFSHNLVASTALCLWGGAYRTASLVLRKIDTLDIHLMFLLEMDRLVELLERPLFRHLHVRMLETDTEDPLAEGSGTMLFQALKFLLMILPQSTCYRLLRDRLVSTSRFRQSVIGGPNPRSINSVAVAPISRETEQFVNRVLDIRQLHCQSVWETIRAESLEGVTTADEEKKQETHEVGRDRREWLGYESKEDEKVAQARYREDKRRKQQATSGVVIEALDGDTYNDFESLEKNGLQTKELVSNAGESEGWKDYWAQNNSGQGSSS